MQNSPNKDIKKYNFELLGGIYEKQPSNRVLFPVRLEQRVCGIYLRALFIALFWAKNPKNFLQSRFDLNSYRLLTCLISKSCLLFLFSIAFDALFAIQDSREVLI